VPAIAVAIIRWHGAREVRERGVVAHRAFA
jgi:hypothetical protein